MDDFEKREKALIDAIKKPIPRDYDSISMRAKYLGLSCVQSCWKTMKLYCKTFKLDYESEKENLLALEMTVMVMSKALEVTKGRIAHQFSEKDKDEIKKIIDDYVDHPALDTIAYFFAYMSIDDIFNPYVIYTVLRSEFEEGSGKVNEAKRSGQSNIVERTFKMLSGSHKTGASTQSKEQHFTKRIQELFGDVSEEDVRSFVTTHLAIQGYFLSFDAFAGVDQEQINDTVKTTLGEI
ncbi:hypothetical protein ACFL0O_05220 [Thermodesulfobacteriota bacterium]